jgi:hypothetical protein
MKKCINKSLSYVKYINTSFKEAFDNSHQNLTILELDLGCMSNTSKNSETPQWSCSIVELVKQSYKMWSGVVWCFLHGHPTVYEGFFLLCSALPSCFGYDASALAVLPTMAWLFQLRCLGSSCFTYNGFATYLSSQRKMPRIGSPTKFHINK